MYWWAHRPVWICLRACLRWAIRRGTEEDRSGRFAVFPGSDRRSCRLRQLTTRAPWWREKPGLDRVWGLGQIAALTNPDHRAGRFKVVDPQFDGFSNRLDRSFRLLLGIPDGPFQWEWFQLRWFSWSTYLLYLNSCLREALVGNETGWRIGIIIPITWNNYHFFSLILRS